MNKKIIKIGLVLPRLDIVGGGEVLILELIKFLAKKKKYLITIFSPDINQRTLKYLSKFNVIVKNLIVNNHTYGRYNIDIEQYNTQIDYNDIYICNHIELSQLRLFPKILYAHEPLRLNTDNFDEDPFWNEEVFDKNFIINSYIANSQIPVKYSIGVAANFLPQSVFTNSLKTKKNLTENTILKNIKVLYPGVNKVRYKKIKKKTFDVLFLGSIAFHKRPNFFVSLAEANKDMNFHMVGRGPELDSFMLSPELNESKNLKIYGDLSDNDLNKLWEKTDCLVNCSSNEPFGINILEAATRGVPVITTKDAGVIEILKKGLILCNLSVDEFSKNLKKLKQGINYKQKSIVLKKLSNRYSWENFSKRFEEEIDSVLKTNRKLDVKNKNIHLLYKINKFYSHEWKKELWGNKVPNIGRYFSESKSVIIDHFKQIVSKGFNVICLEIDLDQNIHQLGRVMLTIERLIRISSVEKFNLRFSFFIKNINTTCYFYFEKVLQIILNINYPNIMFDDKKVVFFQSSFKWLKSKEKNYYNIKLIDYDETLKINNLKDKNKFSKKRKKIMFESFNDFENNLFIEKVIKN